MNVAETRDLILSEIRRLALAAGGKAPGKGVFTRQTGIGEHQWSGVFWARWSEALAEAGYGANSMQGRFDTEHVLAKIIEACRHFGRVPTVSEMKLQRLSDPTFPSKGAISGHFPTRSALLSALSGRAANDGDMHDIAAMLPSGPQIDVAASPNLKEGFVYLLKSSDHYKIGRSDELERRVKEIRIALPEAVTLLHAIRTDDPSGIEAYWHRRFADRRANGEWFKLEPSDLAAFRRRKYQ